MARSDWFIRQLGLYLSEDRLDSDWCDEVRRDSTQWESTESTVYKAGSATTEVLPSSRSSRRVYMADPVESRLDEFLVARLPELSAHFECELGELEEPQLLRYRPGDFFERHRDARRDPDGSMPAARQVSIVVAVSDPGSYEGGEFVAYPELGRVEGAGFNLELPAGALFAFRSDLSHEILPVIAGERFSIVTWAR